MTPTNLNYIPDDGYTEPGYIDPQPLLHGALRFSFRPMITEERAKLLAAVENMSGDAYDRMAADMMAKKLVEWDLVDAKGEPVPISARIVLRLKPALFNTLYKIMLGFDATDRDPDWQDETADLKAAEQYASALSEHGDMPGEVRAEGDAKN